MSTYKTLSSVSPSGELLLQRGPHFLENVCWKQLNTTTPEPVYKPNIILKTGTVATLSGEKRDVTNVLLELSRIYDDMKTMMFEINTTISDTNYTLCEEDFCNVSERWKKLNEKREKTVTQLTGATDMSHEYINRLGLLAKLNKERDEIVEELAALLTVPISKIQREHDEEVADLKSQIAVLKDELATKTELILESSARAATYTAGKEIQIEELRKSIETLQGKYRDTHRGYDESTANATKDLKTRLEDLISVIESGKTVN